MENRQHWLITVAPLGLLDWNRPDSQGCALVVALPSLHPGLA